MCAALCSKKEDEQERIISEWQGEHRGLEMRSHRVELCIDEPLKVTPTSNDRQPSETGHKEFVSTV